MNRDDYIYIHEKRFWHSLICAMFGHSEKTAEFNLTITKPRYMPWMKQKIVLHYCGFCLEELSFEDKGIVRVNL